MDSLGRLDVEEAKRKSTTQRLREALDTMAAGLRMKREALRAANPEESESELQARFTAWLLAGD